VNLTFRRLGVSELLPRYIFTESLFVRRRVLEVGAVSATGGASAEFLLLRGARVVVACDDDLAAVEAAQARAGGANLRFRPAMFDDLPPGGFDLVLVADVAPFVRAPERLRQLVDQVSSTGVFVGGLRNPAGLSLAQLMEPDGEGAPPTYGQVLDALAAHFPHLETATQSPLLGYQLAFERSEGLQVDGTLAGSGEAAYFVVLGSRERLRSVDPTWVQLPPAPLAFTGGRLDEAAGRAREWETRARRLKSALTEVREELARTQGDLGVAQAALERAQEEAVRARAEGELQAQAVLHPVVQDELAARVRRLESELQVAAERAAEAEQRLAARAAESEAARQQERQQQAEVQAAQESVRLERARREELQRQLDDARSKLTAAYEELRQVREELSRIRTEGERGRMSLEARGAEAQQLEERLAQARERELRLAEQHSVALAALEGARSELAHARSRAEAFEQRGTWLEAERARLERAAEADRQRWEEQLAAARATAVPSEAPALEATRTELLAEQGERRRAEDRLGILEAQERTLREVAASLESRLHAAEAEAASLRQAAAVEAGSSVQELATARQALEEAVAATQLAHQEADRQTSELRARLAEEGGRTRTLREQLSQAEERAGAAAALAAGAVARAEQAEEEARVRGVAVEEVRQAMRALELEFRTTKGEADARAERDRAAETASWTSSLAEARERLTSAEGALAESGTREAELGARLAELERHAQALEAERDESRSARIALEQAVAAAQQGAAELTAGWEARLATLETELQHTTEQLAERTESLARAEAGLGELEEARVQAEFIAEERDAALAAHATLVSERDAALAAHATLVSERDAALAAHAVLVSERDVALAERDVALAERDAAHAAHAEAVLEREAVVAERDPRLGAVAEPSPLDVEWELGAVEAQGPVPSPPAAAGELESALAAARTERDAAVERAGTLEARLREVSEQLAGLGGPGSSEEQARAAKAAREQLQVELAQERARLRVLQEEKDAIDALQAELDEQLVRITEDLQTAQFERDALVTQTEQSAAREQSAMQELESERQHLARLESERSSLLAFAERAQDELDAREVAVRSAERILAEAEQGLEAARGREEALNARLDQLQRRLAAQEGELSVLRRATSRTAPRDPEGEGRG
jgi:chromosome segregation ATPase